MRNLVLGVCLVVGSCAIFASGIRVSAPRKNAAGKAGVRLENSSSAKDSRGIAQAAASDPSAAPRVALQYGKLPLSFEPNRGQAHNDAAFLARGDGYSLFLTPAETAVVLRQNSAHAIFPATETKVNKFDAAKAPVVLRMQLAGASKAAHLAALDRLPGKSNYLIGNDPSKWRVNIPNYRQVEERGVYNGVDLIYYGSQRQLEYDFLVAPGADPSVIRLAFQGAEKLRADAEGDLHVTVAGKDVLLHKPVAYQLAGAAKEKVTVAANYVLLGDHDVAFQLGKYDAARQLVIDPILSYSTYLGGTNIDGANAIAVAPDNTAFITGGTFSLDFPVAHPLQPNHGGPDDFSQDAFITKLSADGSTLLYSTYLGGTNQDVANGIAVDAFGDAYVTGTTISPDFPATAGAFDPICTDDGACGAKKCNNLGLVVSNAFVSKLDPEGTGLIYSSFLGDFENVRGLAIAVDSDQSAYVTGSTQFNPAPQGTFCGPFPITANAFQPTFGGGFTDAFVTKISASGSSIEYSTYVGGSNEEIGNGIAVDSHANIYATGVTYSTDFPTLNAVQSVYGGAGDAFLAKLNTNGSGAGSLLYSTYLGGSNLDQGNGVAVDSNGVAYVTGAVGTGALPFATVGTFGGGDADAFAAKLDGTQSGAASLSYFRYVGGSLADSGNAIGVDSQFNAYVTGSTVSPDFPIAGAVFQSRYGGGNADAFVTKLDPTGATLVYSGYIGGTNTDIGYGIAVGADGSAYVAGQTCSLDFPVVNPVQAAPGGNCDAFVSKVSILEGLELNPAGLVFPAQGIGTTSQSQTVTITNGDTPETNLSVAVAGANPGDFAEVNTCPTSLSAGAQCTITVAFTPVAAGLRKAQVNVACPSCGTSGINYVLNLSGQSSTLTLSASNLSFGNVQVGLTSSSQSILATNNGTTALTFSSITASGDYSEADDCTRAPLQPTTTCSIAVVFSPAAAGSSIGGLTLTDNAPGSPQVVLLTGTGSGQLTDFTLSTVQPGATIPAGQSANITLLMSSVGGFSQPVTLSCSGLPRDSGCFTPANPVTLGTNTQVPLTITTGSRTLVSPGLEIHTGPFAGVRYLALGFAGALLVALWAMFRGGRLRPGLAAFGFAAILLLAAAGCNSGAQSGLPAGTPAGTYPITVTATSGTITHTTVVSLQVK
jgi:hypothetical protein